MRLSVWQEAGADRRPVAPGRSPLTAAPRTRPGLRRRLGLCGLLGTLAVAVPVPLAAPASAEEVACVAVGEGDPAPTSEVASEPLEAIGATRAQSWLRRTDEVAGAGTTVAVLSSGISGRAGLPVAEGGTSVVGSGPVVDPTGTVVAGLVAAPPRSGGAADGLPVGVAPGAEVVDVRVLDTASPTQEGQDPPTTEALADGLTHVRDRLPEVDVVVVPLQLPRDDRVSVLVEDLLQDGVVVVAQSGDRPTDVAAESTDPLAVLAEERDDEDAGPLIHPAALDGVLAVGPAPEEIGTPLRSSAIDVVAPSLGAVSVSLEGGTCQVDAGASSWSTGLVAGVVAMLRAAHPRDSAAELVARVVATADGRPDVPSPLTGAGTVSALEALTVTPGELRSGGYAGDTAVPASDATATAPQDPADLLADTRADAVWWGLVGGGVLLLAVLARPLLARRSR